MNIDLQYKEFDLEKLKKSYKEFIENNDEKLTFPSFSDIKVSIVILTYNNAHFSYNCLQSVLLNADVNYEVIIVDNHSTDTTSQLLDKISNAKLVRNTQNQFYATGCNQGAALAEGDYIFFLNNDAAITEGSLSALTNTFSKENNVGAVGGQLIYYSGLLQEAGNIMWSNGVPIGYGRSMSPHDYRFTFKREVDYCSAAALLVPTKLFSEVGGFDTAYEPAYYEDTDLCFKLRERGLKIIFNPKAKFFHNEHTSSSFEMAKEMMDKNREIFCQKWHSLLKSHHKENENNILFARSSQKKKNILFIDNRLPIAAYGAGYPRALEIINTLVDNNYNLTHFPIKKDIVDTSSWLETKIKLEEQGVEVVLDDSTLEDLLHQRRDYFDIIFVSRYSAISKVLSTLEQTIPNVPIIFDTEAIHFLRTEMMLSMPETSNLTISKEDFNREKAIEISIINQCNHIVVVSEQEKKAILEHSQQPEHNISVIGHPVEATDLPPSFNDRSDFLFVGGFLGEIKLNEHAVLYFIEKVWPTIIAAIPNARFHIVGANPPPSIAQHHRTNNIEVHGFIEDLSELYNSSKVFVAANQFAGGIPLKISEALGRGIPCVVSKLIAEQFGIQSDSCFLIGETEQSFANKCIALHTDENLWNETLAHSREFIKSTHSPQKWSQTLTSTFEKMLKTTATK